MTRKQYVRNMKALCEAIQYKYNGKHLDGKVLSYYRDMNIRKINFTSYAEAWESLKPARDLVNM